MNTSRDILKVTSRSLGCISSCPDSLSLLWYAVKSMRLRWWVGWGHQPTSKAYWLTTYNTDFHALNHTRNYLEDLRIKLIRSVTPMLLIIGLGDEFVSMPYCVAVKVNKIQTYALNASQHYSIISLRPEFSTILWMDEQINRQINRDIPIDRSTEATPFAGTKGFCAIVQKRVSIIQSMVIYKLIIKMSLLTSS